MNGMISMRMIRMAMAAAIAGVLVGCTTVSETGRRQLMLISSEQEMSLGISEFQKMKQEIPINKDPELNAMVTRVGERIAAVAPLPNAKWEFVVFESEQPNAFCLPGGKIGIYTGILPITKTEAGLATVMGHEVAHAVAHHGAERISQGMLVQLGGQVLNQTMADRSERAQVLTATAYGLGAQMGAVLPHSRLQESEADHMGLLYMARAGYNPEEAVAFWQRFAEFNRQHGGATPWFLRTHPLDEARIEQLRQRMPEAKRQYRPR